VTQSSNPPPPTCSSRSDSLASPLQAPCKAGCKFLARCFQVPSKCQRHTPQAGGAGCPRWLGKWLRMGLCVRASKSMAAKKKGLEHFLAGNVDLQATVIDNRKDTRCRKLNNTTLYRRNLFLLPLLSRLSWNACSLPFVVRARNWRATVACLLPKAGRRRTTEPSTPSFRIRSSRQKSKEARHVSQARKDQ
jgi:hypothetical protein